MLKTYRSDKGRSAYEGMLGLWQASLVSDGAAAVARPLGYLPDRRLLAQTIVPGDETLEDFLRRTLLDDSPAARAAVHDRILATARGLAALHSSGVRADKTVALDDQLGDARKLIDRLTAAVAPLTPYSALEPVLRRVHEDASPADPLVSSHGGFAPEQVLLADDGVGFVDFDDFCLAEPGMDAGMFAAALADLALSTDEGPSLDTPSLTSKSACFGRLDRAAELAETFLTEYESRAHLTRTRATLWHTVDVVIHAARTWTKVKPAGPMKDLLILEHHLSRLGW